MKILVALASIALALTAIFAWDRTSPGSGVYRNESLGFSIAHPESVRIEPETENGVKFLHLGPKAIPNSEITDGFAVTVMRSPGSFDDLETYRDARIREHEAGLSSEIDEPQQADLGGRRAYRFSFTTALGNRATEYALVSEDGIGYFLTYTAADPDGRGYREEAEKMVQSFSFIRDN